MSNQRLGYSKMYLIPPSLYEILKKCISDMERQRLENINISQNIRPERTVTDMQMENIAQQNVEPMINIDSLEETLPQPTQNQQLVPVLDTIEEISEDDPTAETLYLDRTELQPSQPQFPTYAISGHLPTQTRSVQIPEQLPTNIQRSQSERISLLGKRNLGPLTPTRVPPVKRFNLSQTNNDTTLSLPPDGTQPLPNTTPQQNITAQEELNDSTQYAPFYRDIAEPPRNRNTFRPDIRGLTSTPIAKQVRRRPNIKPQCNLPGLPLKSCKKTETVPLPLTHVTSTTTPLPLTYVKPTKTPLPLTYVKPTKNPLALTHVRATTTPLPLTLEKTTLDRLRARNKKLESLEKRSLEGIAQGKFPCSVCQKTFNRQDNLKRHEETMHNKYRFRTNKNTFDRWK